MCRSTAGPLLAIVGVAGTAAGIAIAIVRERVDRLADSRAARQAAEEQDKQGAAAPDAVRDEPEESKTAGGESSAVRDDDANL